MTLTNGELTVAQIQDVVSIITTNAYTYRKYKRYYLGENPTIMDATPKKAPDNRVPCSFARKIVDTVKGYMFPPGNVKYKSKNNYANQLKKEVLDKNNEELHTARLANDSFVYGVSYELLRVNEQADAIKIYRVSPESSLAIYDDTLDENMIAFAHLVAIVTNVKLNTVKYKLTIYYSDFFVEYESQNLSDFTETGRQDHPFDGVPAIEYVPNTDKIPLFYTVIPLIDEHDKITSSQYANELERFASAYLAMLKRINNTIKDANGKTDAERIEEIRMFDGIGDDGDIKNVHDAIDFIVKPSRGNDVAEAADRFERLIYDLSMVINPNNLEAGTAISGIAYRLKLLPMEFLAADIEANFSIGLQRRFDLIGSASEITKLTPEDITINFDRNIPSDIETIVTTAGNAKGILSDETILGLFPADIVPSVKDELDKLGSQVSLSLFEPQEVNNA